MPGPPDVGASCGSTSSGRSTTMGRTTRGRHSARLFDRARCGRVIVGGAGRSPDRLPDWHVPVDEPLNAIGSSRCLSRSAARLDATRLHDLAHHLSSIFVIFICSVWPMLINTAFGLMCRAARVDQRRAQCVASGHARGASSLFCCRPPLRPFSPACAFSIGIAWLVIVELPRTLVAGTGIGYFVWKRVEEPVHHQRDYRDDPPSSCGPGMTLDQILCG